MAKKCHLIRFIIYNATTKDDLIEPIILNLL